MNLWGDTSQPITEQDGLGAMTWRGGQEPRWVALQRRLAQLPQGLAPPVCRVAQLMNLPVSPKPRGRTQQQGQ